MQKILKVNYMRVTDARMLVHLYSWNPVTGIQALLNHLQKLLYWVKFAWNVYA